MLQVPRAMATNSSLHLRPLAMATNSRPHHMATTRFVSNIP